MSVATITPPAVLPVLPDNVPAELVRRPQWVCWKLESRKPRDKKPTKVPYNGWSGRRAKSDDPQTWCEFDQAVERYRAGEYSGIGYMFSTDGPYVGIDLDNCRDPETGKLEAWAEEILESYAEVSPSGTGVKIICRGKLPTEKTGARRDRIEIYQRGRYFTITGHVINNAPPAEGPDALAAVWRSVTERRSEDRGKPSNGRPFCPAWVTDNAIIERATSARNGDRFRKLFEGDSSLWEDGGAYASQSEADLALCNFLAFYCGRDPDRIERLFSSSGLMREKWERADYSSETVHKAIESCGEFYIWKKPADVQGEVRKPRGGRRSGLIVILADKITNSDRFAQNAGGKLYQYRNGVYRARGESYIKSTVKALCVELKRQDEWSSHVAKEVVEYLRVDAPLLWERPPAETINVLNGLLNVQTRVLASHSPDHLSLIQLPVRYDPATTCPRINEFVEAVVNPDYREAFYEIPASTMTTDRSIQKAILAIGEGGNGKSRALAMIKSFLGSDNVSGLSLHRLESDRFAGARLYGKLANICPDLPSEHLSGTSIFKAIVDGSSDTITGEYKFKDSFDFAPFVRLLFSANHPPQANDASEGFFDRWHVLPFGRRFRGEHDEIPAAKLDAMLSTPAELSGLLNRALDALSRLRSQGRMTETVSTRAAFDEFHAMTDPLSVWLDHHTLDGSDHIVGQKALRAAYNATADAAGRPGFTAKGFTGAVKKLRPNIEQKQRTINGDVLGAYLGIGLKEDQHESRV